MAKIAIYTESKFLPEKNYTFHVIFHEILGIDYEVFDNSVSQVYKFVLGNGKFLEFRDDFFCHIPESIGYCDEKYLPTKISELKGVLPDEKIPFLYGTNIFTDHENSIFCGGDVIGSAFFMLSRWEEVITKKYDPCGRFPQENAIAVKFGFINKPIVHLYAEMFRKLFANYEFNIPQKHLYQKVLSHDVDFLYKWGKPIDFIKSCCGDIFRRFSIRQFKLSISMRKRKEDPYDVYNSLMDLSERNGLKSTFYFLNSKSNEWRLASDKGKVIVENILKRGHNIGIHSNYFLEKDAEKIQNDLQFYENFFNKKLVVNRQHFLKIRMPETFRILERNGILQDSTLYYPNYPGFRTGMCIEHSLFDCETRQQMGIKELPLTLMDVSLQDTRKVSEAIELVDALMETVKKYHGTFCCLWHNSSFNVLEWEYLDGVYEHIADAK